MQLLGAGSTKGFAQRLNFLVGEGLISSEESGWLYKTTDAGNAAAHRGWRPNRDEIDAMLDAMENFVQKFDIKMRTARIKYPAKQGPHTSSIKTSPAQKADGAPKDPDAKVVDLRSEKKTAKDEAK
jgi:hypothetical protein